MQNKSVALVTGANQGIGLQIARDLVAHGFTVLVGSRDLGRGVARNKRPASPRRGNPEAVQESRSERRHRPLGTRAFEAPVVL